MPLPMERYGLRYSPESPPSPSGGSGVQDVGPPLPDAPPPGDGDAPPSLGRVQTLHFAPGPDAHSHHPVAVGDIRYLGALASGYLLCEFKEDLLIVDAHALRERVIEQRLSAEWVDGGISSKRLLMPIQVELNPHERAVVDEIPDVLKQLALDLEFFGGKTYQLLSLPELIVKTDADALLREVLAELGAGKRDPVDDGTMKRVLHAMASQLAGARTATLPQSEVLRLLSSLEPAEITRARGGRRPVLWRITANEHARHFKRT